MLISDLQTVLNRNIGNALTVELASGILTSMAQIQGQREQQAAAAAPPSPQAQRRRTPAEVK